MGRRDSHFVDKELRLLVGVKIFDRRCHANHRTIVHRQNHHVPLVVDETPEAHRIDRVVEDFIRDSLEEVDVRCVKCYEFD